MGGAAGPEARDPRILQTHPEGLSMADARPNRPLARVSVGMPVYNGENYMVEAIESVMAQTLGDFEFVICDNASTDRTEEICRDYAARDPRIRYVRNRINLGGGPNNNRVFELSSAPYFKVHNHDDVMHPEFLDRCVEVLDQEPDVVVAFPNTVDIDPQGRVIKEWEPRPDLCSASPSERCWDALRFGDEPHALFGVMRADVLAQTGLMGSSPSADKVLLAELAMRGRFAEVPKPLFLHREHPLRSVHAAGIGHASMAWWDPRMVGALKFPYWRMFGNLARAIQRVPLTRAERLRCYRALLRWIPDNHHWLKLVYDAAVPARPLIDALYRRM